MEIRGNFTRIIKKYRYAFPDPMFEDIIFRFQNFETREGYFVYFSLPRANIELSLEKDFGEGYN
jgi:hypothetical protein